MLSNTISLYTIQATVLLTTKLLNQRTNLLFTGARGRLKINISRSIYHYHLYRNYVENVYANKLESSLYLLKCATERVGGRGRGGWVPISSQTA